MHSPYLNSSARTIVVPVVTPAAISGRKLSRQLHGTTAAQRAALAALNGGRDLLLTAPSEALIARIFKVSRPTLRAARALPANECAFVAKGQRPLGAPHDRVKAAVRGVNTINDVVQLVIEIGPQRVYDALDLITAPMREAAE